MSEENRTYELGYVLVPTIPEAEVVARVTELKNALAAVEGTVLSEGEAEFIDLAYTIEKNVKSKKMKWSQGYFGWIKFTAAPDALEALKKALDGNLELMRYLLIKTDAENNVVFKKPKVEAKREDASFDAAELEAIAEGMDEESAADTSEEVKEQHEKLPNLEGDMTVETPSETVEA
ncbi:MAG: Ribosomal protein [Candidatus Nomurabacteria bacterium]|nr:Ribosomal protein [Candidatus Nomurabacteria bacterium]